MSGAQYVVDITGEDHTPISMEECDIYEISKFELIVSMAAQARNLNKRRTREANKVLQLTNGNHKMVPKYKTGVVISTMNQFATLD